MLRVVFQRMATYPLIAPFALGYILTRNSRMLDYFYSIRSLPHGVPLEKGLRMANFKGNRIFFPKMEDPSFDDVFLRDVYYPYEPTQEDMVVDIGAHMGFFTVKNARQVRKVVAIEPDPSSFKFLTFNIKINGLSNVIAYNYALGEENGFMFLKRGYGYGRSKLVESSTSIKVKVKTLDSVVKELGISPNIIKIDTEGYEMNVLKGAKDTLVHDKPTLIIASYHYRNETRDIAGFLADMGFTVSVYDSPLMLQKTKETYVYAVPYDA